MSSAVSSRRSPSVEELPEDDVPRHNLLPDDCSFLLMDDADFRVTFNVPASAPPGFHAAAAGNARRLLSFWSQCFSVIPTPSTPTFDQPLSEGMPLLNGTIVTHFCPSAFLGSVLGCIGKTPPD
jgi:hypothetical protein